MKCCELKWHPIPSRLSDFQVMRVRDDTFAATLAAGECLESPTYITPCIKVHPIQLW